MHPFFAHKTLQIDPERMSSSVHMIRTFECQTSHNYLPQFMKVYVAIIGAGTLYSLIPPSYLSQGPS